MPGRRKGMASLAGLSLPLIQAEANADASRRP